MDPEGTQPPRMGCERDFTSLGLTPHAWSGSGRGVSLRRNISISSAVTKHKIINSSAQVPNADSGVYLLPREAENSGLISPSLLYIFCIVVGQAVSPRWCLIGCLLSVDPFFIQQAMCLWLLLGYL